MARDRETEKWRPGPGGQGIQVGGEDRPEDRQPQAGRLGGAPPAPTIRPGVLEAAPTTWMSRWQDARQILAARCTSLINYPSQQMAELTRDPDQWALDKQMAPKEQDTAK